MQNCLNEAYMYHFESEPYKWVRLLCTLIKYPLLSQLSYHSVWLWYTFTDHSFCQAFNSLLNLFNTTTPFCDLLHNRGQSCIEICFPRSIPQMYQYIKMGLTPIAVLIEFEIAYVNYSAFNNSVSDCCPSYWFYLPD